MVNSVVFRCALIFGTVLVAAARSSDGLVVSHTEGMVIETKRRTTGHSDGMREGALTPINPYTLANLSLDALNGGPCGATGDKAGLFAKAYLIATKDLADKRTELLNSLGFCVEQVDPVFTKDTCVSNSPGMTGVSYAHQNAWRSIAQHGARAKKALVLESDFSIGNQSPLDLKQKLQTAYKLSDDFTGLGGCGAPYHLCTTGYYVDATTASTLVAESEPLCKDGESTPPIDNMFNSKCEVGGIRCSFDMTPSMPGLSGNGLFQQDRINFKGLHDAHNRMVEDLTAVDAVVGSATTSNAPVDQGLHDAHNRTVEDLTAVDVVVGSATSSDTRIDHSVMDISTTTKQKSKNMRPKSIFDTLADGHSAMDIQTNIRPKSIFDTFGAGHSAMDISTTVRPEVELSFFEAICSTSAECRGYPN